MVDYEYIQSRGAHGHHSHGRFDAFVGCHREIWIGSDGSGLIRETGGPVSFFTEDGRARWEAAGSRDLNYGPSISLFAPGCLPGFRARRGRLQRHPDGLEAALSAGLHAAQELLGETLVEPEFCQRVYDIAGRLAGVEVVEAITDQMGRAGHGLRRIERDERVELIFSSDVSEMLGYQWFLAEPQPFAPAGTLHSWSAFLARQRVAGLPPEIPPVPQLPCVPPGAGRGFAIRPGFHVGTGYVDDPLPQLAELRAQGVLTDAEYESAKASATRK